MEQLGAGRGVEVPSGAPAATVRRHLDGSQLAASDAWLRRVVVFFDPVQCVILCHGVRLPLGDVGLQEVAPADKANEDVEQERFNAADEDLQVPVPLLMQEVPEGLTMLGLEPKQPTPEEDVDSPQDYGDYGEPHDQPAR